MFAVFHVWFIALNHVLNWQVFNVDLVHSFLRRLLYNCWVLSNEWMIESTLYPVHTGRLSTNKSVRHVGRQKFCRPISRDDFSIRTRLCRACSHAPTDMSADTFWSGSRPKFSSARQKSANVKSPLGVQAVVLQSSCYRQQVIHGVSTRKRCRCVTRLSLSSDIWHNHVYCITWRQCHLMSLALRLTDDFVRFKRLSQAHLFDLLRLSRLVPYIG